MTEDEQWFGSKLKTNLSGYATDFEKNKYIWEHVAENKCLETFNHFKNMANLCCTKNSCQFQGIISLHAKMQDAMGISITETKQKAQSSVKHNSLIL